MPGATSAPAHPVRDPEAVVPAIQAIGIEKSYGHLHALRGADLVLRPGEVLALVGDNGAGKSTLTKIMCGAVTADAGSIEFNGRQVQMQSIQHAHELGVHTVYQDLALAPDLSVADNLFLGRELTRRGSWGRLGFLDRNQMRAETREALSRLGIDLRSLRVPVRDLSGGQRQALAVARAINWATTAVLMDEPTAALGPRQSAIVYDTVLAAAARGLAVLMVSHDVPRMLEVADRIAVMRHGVVVTDRPASAMTLTDVIGLMLGQEVPA